MNTARRPNKMKKKVIQSDNLPTGFPIHKTLTTLLALGYFNASELVIGAVGLLLILLWIVAIVQFADEEKVDILNNNGKEARRK